MDFLNWNEKLKSRKIWFFLQGKTVFIEDKIESIGRYILLCLIKRFKVTKNIFRWEYK